MKQPIILLLLALAAGCSDPTRPRPGLPADTVVLTPRLNVQLGDTPAGQQPEYIVTGNVTAKQGGSSLPARIDSIAMAYRLNNGPWTWLGAPSQLPFSGRIPVNVTAGQHYVLWTALYASTFGIEGERKSGMAEWTAEGSGY